METYTRELYRALGESPDEFTFIGLASVEGFALDLSWFPGEVVNSGISGEKRLEWARGELFAVSRWADRLDADLIHSTATLGPAHSRVPAVLTMHDMLYFSHPQYMSTPLFTEPVKLMEKLAARNASWVLTVSEYSKQEIIKYLKFPPERLQVTLSAGSTPELSNHISPRRDDVIIAIGNRRPHKNFEGLVRAMALVPEGMRPTLIVTGSRGDDPLRPVVDELGLEPWVQLKSWVSDEELDEMYATATAIVIPSFAEGFGLPILEAMGAGLPVLTSDLSVLREVAGDAAVYFDPSDTSTIADAVTRVVSNPDLRIQLEQAGKDQARKFTWQKTAAGTLEGFRSALANPRRRRSR